MSTFIFQAKSPDGKYLKGELDASNEQEARIKLRAQKLIPIQVQLKGGSAKSAFDFSFLQDSVKPKDLQIFTRQFAVLIAAGIPIVQCLEAMAQGARSVALASSLTRVKNEVERGKRLADAMATQPRVFDRLYINLMRAGEEGGVIEPILQRLADYIEKSVKLRNKVVGALWYPAAIIVVAMAVISGIMIFVIPSFVEIFQGSGMELPALTQFVIDLSNLFVNHWYLVLGVMIATPLSIGAYYQTKDGRKVLDEVLINLPIFGPLVQKSSIARMSRTLSTLLSAGVRIIDALDISSAVAGNWMIEKAIKEAKDAVAGGKNLVEPLRRYKYFPSMVLQMISVGETTGNLDIMLAKIADFYEDEVENAADALTSMLEPLLMVFLGVIIAVIVIAMYLPIFELAGSVM